MRIIAGRNRGQRIIGPADASTTRPITDRVKTSLFDRLWALGLLPEDPFDEPSGQVVDVFAGTGTLGLEALSRGAAGCVFVEQDRQAGERLGKNLATTGLGARGRLLAVDALRASWVQRELREPVRLSFVDPPYALLWEEDGWSKLLPLLEALGEVSEPGGVMIVRTQKRVEAGEVTGWEPPEVRKMGTAAVSWYFKSA